MTSALKPILLDPRATLLDAMRAMEAKPKDDHPPGIVLAVDGDGRLAGVVSDGDLRRAMLNGVALEDPIERVMTRDPLTIESDAVQSGSFGTFLRRVRESRRMLDIATRKVIVVDAGQRPIDIVPLLDLLVRHEMASVYAVVLAGGAGTRLWPLSRQQRPKQFLDLTGEGSMLVVTTRRLERLLPMERILVVTTAEQHALVRAEIPALPVENILVEPLKRGTAPCVGLAALHLERVAPEATMLVLPSDHLIVGLDKYLAALSQACFIAATAPQPTLMTIGLRPTFASTAYGYLRLGATFDQPHFAGACTVDRFVEKPPAEEAERMLAGGRHLWNTGTFAWTVRAFRQTVARCAPDLGAGLDRLAACGSDAESVAAAYAALPDISIDYALMERADNVGAVEAEFERIDVGDLRSLARLLPADENGNAASQRWIGKSSGGNIVYSPGRLTALLGIRDTIVIVTDDVVLVCAKDQAQNVLDIVRDLRQAGSVDYV